jgi:hypothetical protein
MNFEITDILELSDNKQYIVTSKAVYEDQSYLYIADIKDPSNIKICCIDRSGEQTNLVIVKNTELIEVLMTMFQKQLDEFRQ